MDNEKEVLKRIEALKKEMETLKRTSDIAQNKGDERTFHLCAEAIKANAKLTMLLSKKLD